MFVEKGFKCVLLTPFCTYWVPHSHMGPVSNMVDIDLGVG